MYSFHLSLAQNSFYIMQMMQWLLLVNMLWENVWLSKLDSTSCHRNRRIAIPIQFYWCQRPASPAITFLKSAIVNNDDLYCNEVISGFHRISSIMHHYSPTIDIRVWNIYAKTTVRCLHEKLPKLVGATGPFQEGIEVSQLGFLN